MFQAEPVLIAHEMVKHAVRRRQQVRHKPVHVSIPLFVQEKKQEERKRRASILKKKRK